MSSHTMSSQWEDITPARAKLDLETAECGRNPSVLVIENYSRDMEAGHWAASPEPVVYDTRDGGKKVLRDGQQRWYGLIKAANTLFREGKISDPDEFSVRFWVTTGSKDEIDRAFPYLNSGKPRSPQDHLVIEGYPNATLLYSIGRRVAMWEAGFPTGTSYKPTRAEVFEIIDSRPLLQEASEVASSWRVKPPVPAPATAGFLWYLLGTVDKDDRDIFIQYLRTATGLPDMPAEEQSLHPLVMLRNRLHGDAYTARQRGYTVKQETVLWLCLRGWRAWRRGEDQKKYQIPDKLSDASFAQFIKDIQRGR